MLKGKRSFKPKRNKNIGSNKDSKGTMNSQKKSKSKRIFSKKGVKQRRLHEPNKKGAVCLKNLPHGFYDRSVFKFFQQFGTITRYKVARSNKNANPMGFAYIEFENYKVAKIVADTMHTYLMFDKILKCRYINSKEIKDKMFSNSKLYPEFCNGTKRKLKNQYKMENVCEEDLKHKLKKKISLSLAKLSRVIGVKIESDPELIAISSKDPDKENESSKQQEQKVSSVECDEKEEFLKVGLESSLIKTPKYVKKNGVRERKTSEEKADKCEDMSKDDERKISKITPKKRKRSTSDKEEGPLVMEIDEVDEEIYFKTPPNVVKIIKKGSQKVICDGGATTVKKSVKRLKLAPLKSVANKLFDKEKDSSDRSRKPRTRRNKNTNQSKMTTDMEKANFSVENSHSNSKVKSEWKVKSISKKVEKAQNIFSNRNKSEIKDISTTKNPVRSIKKNKTEKGMKTDFTSILTKERCINISEKAAIAQLTTSKEKRSNKKNL